MSILLIDSWASPFSLKVTSIKKMWEGIKTDRMVKKRRGLKLEMRVENT